MKIKKIMKSLGLSFTLTTALFTTVKAVPTSHPAVEYNSYQIGGVTIQVIAVDTTDPTIGMSMKLSNDTIGSTASFQSIVAEEGSLASINGNFFESYTNNVPIGNLMIDGTLVYGSSGMPNMGFTQDGSLYFGMPGYFTRLHLISPHTQESVGSFLAYDVNIQGQNPSDCYRLYNDSYGSAVSFTQRGMAYIFANDTFTSYQGVEVGSSIAIPKGGMVLYQSHYAEEWAVPSQLDAYIGWKITSESILVTQENETISEFTGVNLWGLMAGNSRLVQEGQVVVSVYPEGTATDSRWTLSTTRTAIGELADGRMILVHSPSASLYNLAKALVEIGCVNGINLDGGASSAMALDGQILAMPGRNLACTFHVYQRDPYQIPEEPDTPVIEESILFGYQKQAEYLSLLGEEGLMRPNEMGGFDLDQEVTRAQAATMMVRLLGAEKEALDKQYSHPFDDVPYDNWASPYIGYLYEKKLTAGVSENQFAPNDPVNANTYITFILRAANYGHAEGEPFTLESPHSFHYASAMEYAQYYFRLTPAEIYYFLEEESRPFYRDDMAAITYNALNLIKYYNSWPELTLAGYLLEKQVFDYQQAEAARLAIAFVASK